MTNGPKTPAVTFSRGDRVVHGEKPEWGVGEVMKFEPVVVSGIKGQKITVKFERVGAKAIATPLVEVKLAEDDPADAIPAPKTPEQLASRLSVLPDDVGDPFRTEDDRARAIVAWYRYEGTSSGLIDWAVARSRIADPLSMLTRHELEQCHTKYRIQLDRTLVQTAESARKNRDDETERVLAQAPSNVQRVLRDLHVRR